jgi:hypothetical protein
MWKGQVANALNVQKYNNAILTLILTAMELKEPFFFDRK